MDQPLSHADEAGVVAFDVLGVGVVIRSNCPELTQRVRAIVPPVARERDVDPGAAQFTIDPAPGDGYRVTGPGWEETFAPGDAEGALNRLRVEVLEHVLTAIVPPPPAPEPPPAVRFVSLVLELEGELVELAKMLDTLGVDAMLRNGPDVRPALAHGPAFSFSALLEISRAQIPRAVGAMESAGWRRLPHGHGARYIRRGMVVRLRPRPPALRRRGGTLAKGRLGFLEPVSNVAKGKPQGPLAPLPLDPGGSHRAGWGGTALQCAAEALTALDSFRLRTKEREFRGIPIQYGPGVFAFQPLTAAHVEAILSRLPRGDSDVQFVEVGTGTGAVALSIAKERPRSHVLATDVSLRALGWARRNRRRLGLRNVRLAQGSLLAPVPRDWRGRVAAIAANLPLGPPRAAIELHVGDDWPIGTATGSGADGLGLMRALARDAREVLAPGGYLHLQLQDMQSAWIAGYFHELGYETEDPGPAGGFELTARWPG